MDYEQAKRAALEKRAKLAHRRTQVVQEKARLVQELQEIDREDFGLEQVLEGLEFLVGDVPPDLEPLGFTGTVREILQRATEDLTPVEIRNSLMAAGIKGSSPRNLLIGVQTVLTREAANIQKTPKNETDSLSLEGYPEISSKKICPRLGRGEYDLFNSLSRVSHPSVFAPAIGQT